MINKQTKFKLSAFFIKKYCCYFIILFLNYPKHSEHLLNIIFWVNQLARCTFVSTLHQQRLKYIEKIKTNMACDKYETLVFLNLLFFMIKTYKAKPIKIVNIYNYGVLRLLLKSVFAVFFLT